MVWFINNHFLQFDTNSFPNLSQFFQKKRVLFPKNLIFPICKNNTLTLNRFIIQIEQQVKEMDKQKYYGKESYKVRYPNKKKEKSKGKYLQFEDGKKDN